MPDPTPLIAPDLSLSATAFNADPDLLSQECHQHEEKCRSKAAGSRLDHAFLPLLVGAVLASKPLVNLACTCSNWACN